MKVFRDNPRPTQPPYWIELEAWETRLIRDVLDSSIQHNVHADWCMKLKAMLAEHRERETTEA